MDIRLDMKTAMEFMGDKRFASLLKEAGFEYVEKMTEIFHKHGLSFIEGNELMSEAIETVFLYR